MQCPLIAVLLAFVAFSSAAANPQLLSAHLKMLDVMSATSEMQRSNPVLASTCFDEYKSVMDDYNEVYKKEYNQCDNTRIEGTNGILTQYDPLVDDLGSSVYRSCQVLINCSQKQNNSLDALNCLSVQGSADSRNSYEVSSNATISAGILAQSIKDLQFTFELCANKSAKYFENKSGVAYIDFQNCLKGYDTWTKPDSTASPSTTIRPNTTEIPTTTEAPTTSTHRPNHSTERPSTISHFQSNDGKPNKGWEGKLDNIINHIFN
ncbi:hypothetical protein KR026_000841 [Drosophila bipectinata]|nr:hypothetical protein KR026_000841 [Drosophila bipectinata]